MRILEVVALAATLVAGTQSKAAILFQSIPDLAVSTPDNACSTCSFANAPIHVFDIFSLDSSATIQSIQFVVLTGYRVGSYGYQFPISIDLGIWSAVPAVLSNGQLGTLPGNQIFGETFAPQQFTSVFNTPYNTTIVTIDPIGLNLAAGTYEISFYNSNDLIVAWFKGGTGLSTQLPSSANYPSGDLVGFELDGSISSVPLPSTWTMMLIGFAGIGFAAYRRTRKQTASLVAA